MNNYFVLDTIQISIILLGLFFYLSISFIFYKSLNSEIKLMRILRDPKTAARNRKQIDRSIELAEKEKKFILLWPVFLLKGLLNNVKNKIEKKE